MPSNREIIVVMKEVPASKSTKSSHMSFAKTKALFKKQSANDPKLPRHIRAHLQREYALKKSWYKVKNPPGFDIDHTRNDPRFCRWQYSKDNRARGGVKGGRYEKLRTISLPPNLLSSPTGTGVTSVKHSPHTPLKPSSTATKFRAGGKALGKAAVPVGIVMSGYEVYTAENKLRAGFAEGVGLAMGITAGTLSSPFVTPVGGVAVGMGAGYVGTEVAYWVYDKGVVVVKAGKRYFTLASQKLASILKPSPSTSTFAPSPSLSSSRNTNIEDLVVNFTDLDARSLDVPEHVAKRLIDAMREGERFEIVAAENEFQKQVEEVIKEEEKAKQRLELKQEQEKSEIRDNELHGQAQVEEEEEEEEEEVSEELENLWGALEQQLYGALAAAVTLLPPSHQRYARPLVELYGVMADLRAGETIDALSLSNTILSITSTFLDEKGQRLVGTAQQVHHLHSSLSKLEGIHQMGNLQAYSTTLAAVNAIVQLLPLPPEIKSAIATLSALVNLTSLLSAGAPPLILLAALLSLVSSFMAMKSRSGMRPSASGKPFSGASGRPGDARPGQLLPAGGEYIYDASSTNYMSSRSGALQILSENGENEVESEEKFVEVAVPVPSERPSTRHVHVTRAECEHGAEELLQLWHEWAENKNSCEEEEGSDADKNIFEGLHEDRQSDDDVDEHDTSDVDFEAMSEWNGFDGYEYSNDLWRVVPHELVLLHDEDTELLFIRNYVEMSLLCYRSEPAISQREHTSKRGGPRDRMRKKNYDEELDEEGLFDRNMEEPEEDVSLQQHWLPASERSSAANPVKPKPPRVDPPRGKGKRSGCVVM